MRTLTILLAAVILLGVLGLQAGIGQPEKKAPNADAISDPSKYPVTPINNPDKFAWQLFAYVNAESPMQTKVKSGGKEVTTNSALWETWASDSLTFQLPPFPPPDAKNPPKWPEPGQTRRMDLRRRALSRKRSPLQKQSRISPEATIEKPEEEVFRNKAAFEHIIKNNLWYRQGLVAAFKNGQNTPGFSIIFPKDSIEIKANWIKITPDQKSKFHWNYDQNGDLYGLIAMHISSKVLPHWFWATFEWVDNPGRSDYIGSRDAFGVAYKNNNNNPPSFQPPLLDDLGRQITGRVYPPGEVTEALLKLFQNTGMKKDWINQWLNYRLKGSQVDFADSTGIPTLLGNSRTEAGFVPSASCITCHARASINSQGQDPFNGGFKEQLFPPVGILAESPNSYPDPNWFWKKGVGGPIQKNLQVDFVWALLRARPAKE